LTKTKKGKSKGETVENGKGQQVLQTERKTKLQDNVPG